MKILIIEDEVLIQKSLNKLLSREGAETTAVSQGVEAISLIKINKYDRIICDLMLQDITGFDILEEAKKEYSEEELKSTFIIITAYSSPQVLEKANSYGCMVINKPFSDIKETINIFLDKKEIS